MKLCKMLPFEQGYDTQQPLACLPPGPWPSVPSRRSVPAAAGAIGQGRRPTAEVFIAFYSILKHFIAFYIKFI